jgi:hypothetical protein
MKELAGRYAFYSCDYLDRCRAFLWILIFPANLISTIVSKQISRVISGYIPIFIPGDGGGVSDVSVRSELSELVDDPEKLRLIGNGGG